MSPRQLILDVPGLKASGHFWLGDEWLACWAEATRPIYDEDEHRWILKKDGFPTDDLRLTEVRIVNRLPTGYRSWWYGQRVQKKES